MNIESLRLAVLDSSVIIKWYRAGEPLRPQALALRTAYLDGALDLAMPDLLIYEVSNALRYKSDFSADDVCGAIQDIFDMDVAIITVTADVATRAIRLARQYDLSVYDAALIACAEHAGVSLITADEALFRKASVHPAIVYLGDLASNPIP